jgi:hypothetical protein
MDYLLEHLISKGSNNSNNSEDEDEDNIYINCLYHLNGTWNSRVSGHGIRMVLYALVRLVTVVVLLK